MPGSPGWDVASGDTWTTSSREVLDFAGVPEVEAPTAGYPYSVWRHRSGGWFALPAGPDRRAGRLLRTFSRAFPGVARADRLSWRLRAHRKLYLEAAAVDELSSILDDTPDGARPGFHVAVPGAYRKITFAVVSPDGSVGMFGKLAAHPGGEARIVSEYNVLERLAQIGGISGRVPRSEGLASFRGKPLLMVSPGPAGAGERRFGRTVGDFLAILQAGTRSGSTARFSGSVRRWRESIDRLTGGGADYPELMRAAAERLEARLEDSGLPTSLAHGDFTAANTRTGAEGLFVFDWEAAFEGAMPGHDAFHFVTLPRALRGRDLTMPVSVSTWLQESCPESAGYVRELWLAYLLETGLQYAMAREAYPEEGDDRVFLAILAAMSRELEAPR